MKKLLFLTAVSGILLLSFSSCKKDDNSNSNSNSTVTNIVQQGDWKITLFSDDGKDELYHYTGYTFTFVDGKVTATKSGSTFTGTYSSGTDDSQEKLNLDFGSSDPFEELNEDWHILEQTSTKIRLEHVSGGNGGIDLLTFEKN